MSISDTVNQLSTSELLEYVHDKSAVIIDIRTVDAYNGLKLVLKRRAKKLLRG